MPRLSQAGWPDRSLGRTLGFGKLAMNCAQVRVEREDVGCRVVPESFPQFGHRLSIPALFVQADRGIDVALPRTSLPACSGKTGIEEQERGDGDSQRDSAPSHRSDEADESHSSEDCGKRDNRRLVAASYEKDDERERVHRDEEVNRQVSAPLPAPDQQVTSC